MQVATGIAGQIVTPSQGARPADYAKAGVPARVPVRSIALATGLTCLVAQLLSRVVDGAGPGETAPWSIVVGQGLWNAAQVGFLLLLFCLWRMQRRWWVVASTIAGLFLLPFAIYAVSPGAAALAAVLAVTCLLARVDRVDDVGIFVQDVPARRTPAIAKLEMIALLANLLCSMYNFNPSKNLVPYWAALFGGIGRAIDLEPDQTVIAHAMFGLGLNGVALPSYINLGVHLNSFGGIVYALIWSILPTLYVAYFVVLAILAKDSPGTRVQQLLCAICIAHFLFLTDIVDHRFGRGITNPSGKLAHWIEVFAWRTAILLPLYQKLTTRHWRHGNGVPGIALHYAVGVWALFFLIWEVMLLDAYRFYSWIVGYAFTPIKLFGFRPEIAAYNGALVLMVLLYGFMLLAMRCKRVSVRPLS